MAKVRRGGGWPAVGYAWSKAREAGGLWPLYKALRSKNACKSCALGMGGQQGGMVNEVGQFPQVCKKSMQAAVGDMQAPISSDFWQRHSIADLQAMTPRELEYCGRLVEPVLFRHGQSHYTPISWSDAQARIATHLKATPPQETFWYASGRSCNEAAFVLQLFARLYGTNSINNVSYYCHNASSVGLASVTGSGTATIVLDDIQHADMVFVIGGNPASNHPRLMHTLIHVRRRGGRVVVINPVVEVGLVNFSSPGDPRSLLFGSDIASLYVQPQIGGDLALLTGMAKRIDEMGATDLSFLEQHCTGWPELANRLRSLSWEEIIAKSGVSQDDIQALADIYAGGRNVVFAWTMGITHHLHGVENVQAIANLALMRGMVGRPHAGLLPIRGHSNVQGMGSVGVTPKLKEAFFAGLQSHFGVTLPTSPGLDTMAAMEAAAAGRLTFAFCLGGNLYGSNPDAAFAGKALSNLRLLVNVNTKLNTGHAHALAEETLILPSLPRDEEPQATTQESMFNFIRLSDGGPQRYPGPRSEVEVVAQLAEAVLGPSAPVDWRAMTDARQVRAAIAAVVPGFEAMARIDETKQEFHVSGRIFHTPRFATADGRANLHVHDLPALQERDGMLRLMTVRSEGQFNTVVYEDHDLYRGVEGRDVILLNPQDLERLGLRDGQRVRVRSETGAMPAIRAVAFANIRAGNALMYYPEANVLVGRSVDPQSKTPAYKNVLVRIEAA